MPFEPPPSPRTWLTAQRGGKNRWPSATLVSVLMIAGTSAALIGCAAPGEPTARHPVVPRAVQDLAARQEGDGVELSFTLPSESTDKKPLGEPPALEIYRGTPAPNGPAGAKATMRLVDTVPSDLVDSYEESGHIEFRDRLDPNELARAPGQQVSYMVRTRVSRQRASADSVFASLRVYPAPEPVGELRAAITEKGVTLTWAAPELPGGASSGAGAGAGYRIYRAEVEPESAAAAAEDSSKAVLRAPFNSIGLVREPAYEDTDIEIGHTYIYKIRSVAQFGSDAVESVDSSLAVVTPRDVFPPAAPQGVVAVEVPETAGMPAYVELSWAISPEVDLAGYAIYRSEQPDTTGERLNGELLPAPTFRDTDVVSGRRYFYQVRAVDRAGNESPLSAVVEAEVAGRQP